MMRWNMPYGRQVVAFILMSSGYLVHGKDSATPTGPEATAQYCDGENFHAKCPDGHVIYMQHAKYGKMDAGRCLGSAYGPFGCYDNVLLYFDNDCSGRQECTVRVSSMIDMLTAHGIVPTCPKEVRGYLEASFLCIKVTELKRECCGHAEPDYTLQEPRGYLASHTTHKTRCGSLDCPWRLLVPEGQKIRITMFDFNMSERTRPVSPGSGSPVAGEICHVYVTIKEPKMKASETVCGGTERQSVAYMSRSNEVEIRVVGGKKESPLYFMLYYEAQGCPDLPAPRHGWIRRIRQTSGDDVMLAGCNETHDTWRLTCVNNKWSGKYENCTAGAGGGTSKDPVWGMLDSQNVAMSLVVILLIAVAIGISILIIGLVLLKRRRRAAESRTRTVAVDERSSFYRQNPQHLSVNNNPKPMEHQVIYEPPMNDYYRTWQLQKHQMAGPVGQGMANQNSGDTIPPDYTRYVEHVYESPKFSRKNTLSDLVDKDSTQYFELDPNEMEMERHGAHFEGPGFRGVGHLSQ